MEAQAKKQNSGAEFSFHDRKMEFTPLKQLDLPIFSRTKA